MTSSTPSALKQLFPELTRLQFMTSHWSKAPYIHHGDQGRFDIATQQPELTSLEGLLRAHHGNISAYYEDNEGNLKARSVTGTEAIAAVKQGHRLLVHHVAAWSRPVAAFIDRLVYELGLPRHAARTSMFVTPPGATLRKHFDDVEVFVLQLVGVKRWWLAPNTLIEHPIAGLHVPGHVPPELASLLARLPDAQVPPKAVHFNLTPGSGLYFPCGYWHSTEAEDLCISLSIGVDPPTWAEVVSERLKTQLEASPSWRQRAFTGRGRQREREQAEQTLRRLLAGVPEAIGNLDAGALLDALEGDNQRSG